MSKGTRINEDVEVEITKAFLKYPRSPSKVIQKEVEKELRTHNPQLKRGWPGVSAIQQRLAILRPKYRELINKGLENTWTLYSYQKFEVPPSALPIVLQAWFSARTEEGIALTNREVKWIIRLHKVIGDITLLKKEARKIAFSELGADLAGRPHSMGHPSYIPHLIELMTGKRFNKEEYETLRLAKRPNYVKEFNQLHALPIDEWIKKYGDEHYITEELKDEGTSETKG